MRRLDCVYAMAWRGLDAELRHWPVDMVVNNSGYDRIALHFPAAPSHIVARWTFCERTEIVAAAGGPLEFARGKLDARANTPAQRASEASARQLSLF